MQLNTQHIYTNVFCFKNANKNNLYKNYIFLIPHVVEVTYGTY